MFGKKKSVGNTVLILDVESGSVASALVDLHHAQPQILAYQRTQIPLQQSRSSATIVQNIEQALLDCVQHSAIVAARMRTHAPGQSLGHVHKAVVFLAAPWGNPNLEAGRPHFAPGICQSIKMTIKAAFGDVPVIFYTSADAIAYGTRFIHMHQDTMFVSLRSEMLELLLLNQVGPQAYATLPQGSRSVLRTLQSHGSLSAHEAHSMLHLTKHTDNSSYEPLLVAGRHLSDMFLEGARLLQPAGTTSLVVIGEEPLGEWFAKHIAGNPSATNLFSEEATIEALLPHHMADHTGQSSVRDPYILMESLFVATK